MLNDNKKMEPEWYFFFNKEIWTVEFILCTYGNLYGAKNEIVKPSVLLNVMVNQM